MIHRNVTFKQEYIDDAAKKVAAAMVSTIAKKDDHQRFAELAERKSMNVSQWIAENAYNQAEALYAERVKRLQGTQRATLNI